MSEDLYEDVFEVELPIFFLQNPESSGFIGCEAEGKPEVRAFAVFDDSDLAKRFIEFHELDALIGNADKPTDFIRTVKEAQRQNFTHVAINPRERGKMKWLMTIETVLQRIGES